MLLLYIIAAITFVSKKEVSRRTVTRGGAGGQETLRPTWCPKLVTGLVSRCKEMMSIPVQFEFRCYFINFLLVAICGVLKRRHYQVDYLIRHFRHFVRFRVGVEFPPKA